MHNRLTSFVLVALALGALAALQAQDRPDVQLKAAVYKETVEGDLQGAIALYKQIASNAATPRPVAAAALLALGGCYEKAGEAQATEARKVYERLVADYSDQSQEASQARARLAALATVTAARAGDSRLSIRRVPFLDMEGNPSPDGKYLAYVDWETANVALYDVATGSHRPLTNDGHWGGPERYPSSLIWSPDSREIAYTWNMGDPQGYHSELRALSLDKAAPPRTITGHKGELFPLGWAPDGRHILCGLYVKGSDTRQTLMITVGTGAVEKLNLPAGESYRFTPDGGSIFYSRPADGEWNPFDIYLYDLKSGKSRTIIQHPAGDRAIGILPGTDWFLFASNRRGSVDLWGVRFREGQAVGQPLLIKQGLQRFTPLSFTNDGAFYYATRAVTDDVFLADIDPKTQKILGEPRRLISRWEGTTMGGSFSPDGKSIAYVAYRGSGFASWGGFGGGPHATDSLIVQSLEDGSALPTVVDFSEFHLEHVNPPSWAPDGRSVVLAGQRRDEKGGSASAVFRVDLPSLHITDIYWAPEGRSQDLPKIAATADWLYFPLRAAKGLDTVMRVGQDGGNEKEIFRAPEGQAIMGIALSPDERTLSVIMGPGPLSAPSSRRTLLLVPLNGGSARQLHEFTHRMGGGLSHAWAPDGKSILYAARDTAGVDDWSIQRISVSGGAAPETVYRWGTGLTSGVAFHPSGRMITFTGRVGSSNTSDAWVVENLKDELKRLAAESDRR
jgi:Tol biopolymer transport system component